MKRAIVAVLAALGGLVILGFLFIFALSWAVLAPTPLPSSVVLELDLEEGIIEGAPSDPFTLALQRSRLQTVRVVETLERAADDDRVVGLLVRGGQAPGGWATTQELRDAVIHFRESGKPAVLFAQTFGEFAPGQAGYYFATAFDEILLQPSGDVGLLPLTLEAPFFRGALDRLDVEPRFDRRWEYKDATEIFTREGFSDPSREASQALLESLLESMVEGIAQGRSLPADSVRALVAAGPFMARDALEAGLVDRLAYLDDAREQLLEAGGDRTERLAFARYSERDGRVWNRGPRVALIYGSGTIVQGRSGFDPFTGGSSFAASTVAGHLRAAIEDETVRAILFRVDSPGGSYVASDVVRRELIRAREKGKPVVVSMGNTAASGGYLVSTDAARIVAHPATLTGSIGVLAGKFVTGDLAERLGITWDRIEAGGESTFFSGFEDFSEREWERFQEYLDRVYDEFVGMVADGRGMDRAQVDQVARGRVWTGRDALEVGLVDDLGGFRTALAAVREELELEPDVRLNVTTFPAERTLFQLLMEDGFQVTAATVLAGRAAEGPWVEALRPLLRQAEALGVLGGAAHPVRMPPLEIPAR